MTALRQVYDRLNDWGLINFTARQQAGSLEPVLELVADGGPAGGGGAAGVEAGVGAGWAGCRGRSRGGLDGRGSRGC